MSRDLRLALPKGRMQEGVFRLLAQAGVDVRLSSRGYRPTVSLEHTDAKLLKPQNIVEMLDVGTRDLGFAGADWVAELGADLVEILDTRMDPVRVVAAAPADLVREAWPPTRPIRVASEYERLTRNWIAENNLDARFIRTYGATEVFPPEDADCIVDNTATGATLVANNLDIVGEVMRSSTRLYASKEAMADPALRARIEDLRLLLGSVLEARRRVMLEVNCGPNDLDALVELLPCMREPTISRLFRDSGYAVKVAVPREQLAALVPRIRAAGGTDIVVSQLTQIVG